MKLRDLTRNALSSPLVEFYPKMCGAVYSDKYDLVSLVALDTG